MVYQHPKGGRGRSNYNAANKVYESLIDASRELGIVVEDPFWIELDNEADLNALEEEI